MVLWASLLGASTAGGIEPTALAVQGSEFEVTFQNPGDELDSGLLHLSLEEGGLSAIPSGYSIGLRLPNDLDLAEALAGLLADRQDLELTSLDITCTDVLYSPILAVEEVGRCDDVLGVFQRSIPAVRLTGTLVTTDAMKVLAQMETRSLELRSCVLQAKAVHSVEEMGLALGQLDLSGCADIPGWVRALLPRIGEPAQVVTYDCLLSQADLDGLISDRAVGGLEVRRPIVETEGLLLDLRRVLGGACLSRLVVSDMRVELSDIGSMEVDGQGPGRALESLVISSCSVTAQSLEALAGLASLRVLALADLTLVPGQPWRGLELSGIGGNLKSLTLVGLPIAPIHERIPDALTRLKVLQIMDCALPEDIWGIFPSLTSLKEIRLEGVQATIEFVVSIARVETLTSMDLRGVDGMTDYWVSEIIKGKDLVEIELTGPGITDAGLLYLAAISTLHRVVIMNPLTDDFATEVTARGVLAFQRLRPDCHLMGPW